MLGIVAEAASPVQARLQAEHCQPRVHTGPAALHLAHCWCSMALTPLLFAQHLQTQSGLLLPCHPFLLLVSFRLMSLRCPPQVWPGVPGSGVGDLAQPQLCG